ncbi:MAG: ATP-dependent helicase [Candidatus Limnocylindrales bacterium]
MAGHLPSILVRLAADQFAAATAPPGPVLCVAPAGSGKTTTLLARLAWRLADGADPASVCVVTFNRRAAEELRARLRAPLAELGQAADSIRVRTFHALGREILADAGRTVEPLVERAAVLAGLAGERLPQAAVRRLDDAIARLKLEVGVTPAAARARAAAEEAAGRAPDPILAAYLAYEHELAARGALDHDDLVRGALEFLDASPPSLSRWRARCRVLLVDEVQDLDRSQWRLALLLAAPANDIFLVGDDDQTIYAWRLADARRMLGLAEELPDLRRVHLVTNYRCPAEVVTRAVRLVGHNVERFAKAVAAAPDAGGRLLLAPDPGDDVARARRLLGAWADALAATPSGPAPTHAVLARTNAELAPFAAVALELGLPYRTDEDGLLLEEAALDALSHETLAAWSAGLPPGVSLEAALATARTRRAELRRADAPLALATAHSTKGLEFDVVACVGLDEGRFPSARSLAEAADPARTLEEERRLAYVAWTRARRELWLIYDPGAPSRFVREAFEPEELAWADQPEPSAIRCVVGAWPRS